MASPVSGCLPLASSLLLALVVLVGAVILVDHWHSGWAEYYSPATYLNSGVHEVIVEYFEGAGEAEIRLWWE